MQQATAPMDWSGLPAGCTRPGPLAARGEAAYVETVSAYAYPAASEFLIQLADFQLEPTRRPDLRPTRGRQRIFQISLGRARGDRLPKAGPYQRRTRRTAALVLHDGDAAPARVSEEPRVVVTHADKTWVCGTVELPSTGSGKQPFAARIAR